MLPGARPQRLLVVLQVKSLLRAEASIHLSSTVEVSNLLQAANPGVKLKVLLSGNREASFLCVLGRKRG